MIAAAAAAAAAARTLQSSLVVECTDSLVAVLLL